MSASGPTLDGKSSDTDGGPVEVSSGGLPVTLSESPVTADEGRLTAESARLPMAFGIVFVVIGAVATAALAIRGWLGGDPTGGLSELAAFAGGATILAIAITLIAWLVARGDKSQTNSTWARGRFCFSSHRDYTDRALQMIYTLSVGAQSFDLGEMDFKSIRERVTFFEDGDAHDCFDGAVQYVGSTLLRVESPAGNLVFYDGRLLQPTNYTASAEPPSPSQ